jgi:arylsulfatase A-like enzyme
MITEVDKACENLVNELKKQKILDNTLIIFTVDNGFFLGEHGLSGKWYPYQESIRVPLIIRDPRMPQRKKGTLDDSFTLNIDLATTILGAANVKPASSMQGRDMSDLYLDPKAKDTWRKEFFYEHMSMGRDYIPASSALVRKDFKYFLYEEWDTEQLFDLKNDPYENHDLSNQSEYAELLKEMKKRHDELKALAA